MHFCICKYWLCLHAYIQCPVSKQCWQLNCPAGTMGRMRNAIWAMLQMRNENRRRLRSVELSWVQLSPVELPGQRTHVLAWVDKINLVLRFSGWAYGRPKGAIVCRAGAICIPGHAGRKWNRFGERNCMDRCVTQLHFSINASKSKQIRGR